MREGEYNVGMKALIATQLKIAPPPFLLFEMGEVGRGSYA
jgi:hypothetical protein